MLAAKLGRLDGREEGRAEKVGARDEVDLGSSTCQQPLAQFRVQTVKFTLRKPRCASLPLSPTHSVRPPRLVTQSMFVDMLFHQIPDCGNVTADLVQTSTHQSRLLQPLIGNRLCHVHLSRPFRQQTKAEEPVKIKTPSIVHDVIAAFHPVGR
jgi:hypothetical protein